MTIVITSLCTVKGQSMIEYFLNIRYFTRKKHHSLPIHIRFPCPQTMFDVAFISLSMLLSFNQRSGMKVLGSKKYLLLRNIPWTLAWTCVYVMERENIVIVHKIHDIFFITLPKPVQGNCLNYILYFCNTRTSINSNCLHA